MAGRTVPTAAGAAPDGDEAVGAAAGGAALIGTAAKHVREEISERQLGQQQRSDRGSGGVLPRSTWFSEGPWRGYVQCFQQHRVPARANLDSSDVRQKEILRRLELSSSEMCPHCNRQLSEDLGAAVDRLVDSKKSFKIQCNECRNHLMQMGYCSKCDYWAAYLGGRPLDKGGPCGQCGSITPPPQVERI